MIQFVDQVLKMKGMQQKALFKMVFGFSLKKKILFLNFFQ